jgi:hypothetical protein
MKASKLSLAVGMLVAFVVASPALGKPPTTKSNSQWYNPADWSWPSMPWSSEPARIKKKSPGVMTQMNQSAKRSWTKTKEVLDPSRMFVSDPKPSASKQAKKSEPGFWDSLFGAEEVKEDNSVNSFLRAPMPK